MGLATPAERDPVGGDLQRADHRRADPARPPRRRLPSRRRRARCSSATCSSTASAASSPRSSGSRRSTSSSPPSTSPRTPSMTTFLRHRLWPAIALLVVMTLVTGVALPARRDRGRPGRLPAPGQRVVHRRRGRPDRRLEPDRAGVSATRVLLGPAVRGRGHRREPAGLRRERLGRLEPRARPTRT